MGQSHCLSRPIRLITVFVALIMAYGQGYAAGLLGSWKLGLVIAMVANLVGAIYMLCVALYMWWRVDRLQHDAI